MKAKTLVGQKVRVVDGMYVGATGIVRREIFGDARWPQAHLVILVLGNGRGVYETSARNVQAIP